MSDDTQIPASGHDKELAKLARLIEGIKVCMFTTTGEDGKLISRPMAVQEVEFDGDLWFFTKRNGRKAGQLAREPRVNVSLSSRKSWISISGEAEVVHDSDKARELWNPGIEAWFPDGPDDPDVTLIRLHADGAEYWDTPGQVIVSVLSFVKAKVTGRPHHIEDRKVNL